MELLLKNTKILLEIGSEVSEIIGVIKYEPPLPKEINAIGNMPYGIPVTDEDRFENIKNKIAFGEIVDITLKIDGQSTTYGYSIEDDRFFVTSRRLEINPFSDGRYTIHVSKVKDKIIEYCKKHNISLAFRGESYGNGIQNFEINPHAKLPASFAVFSIWKMNEREYATKGDQHYYVDACKEAGIETVEMVEENVILTEELIKKYSEELTELNGKPFEGVVVKTSKGSFKIINKHYDANK